MAALYSNENFPVQVVEALRVLGHDVLTSLDAGQANQSVPDDQVLAYATARGRILLTLNRRDFIRLHESNSAHAGLIVCTQDPDAVGQASRIHQALQGQPTMAGQLLRVNRPLRK